jgi:hypothetical protein
MQRLTKQTLPETLKKMGFQVTSDGGSAHCELFLSEKNRTHIRSRSVVPCMDASKLPHFLMDLAAWVSSKSRKIVWIENSTQGFLSYDLIFERMVAADSTIWGQDHERGLFFEEIDFQEAFDQNLEKSLVDEVNLLIGVLSVIVLADWSAKMLSENSRDHIEFWEGNVIFHSENREKMQSAMELADRFRLPKIMK